MMSVGVRAAWLLALLVAPLTVVDCAGQLPVARTPPAAGREASSAAPRASVLDSSLPTIRLRRPDFARPASVAAAFFTAWASVDTRDNPDTGLDRCAYLATPALKRQLAVGQTAPAAWRAMRAEHIVSVVHVLAVTHPAGAPPPLPGLVYLRVYAQRVTTTSAGRTVTSDGITVQLVRRHGRWLVARLLFY
jgi:hypothetical protein